MNCTNENLVGKFFLENPDDITIPFYEAFNFADAKEKASYKVDKNKGNFVMEIYSQGDVLDFGKIVLNLPEPSSILDNIEKNIVKFKKKD